MSENIEDTALVNVKDKKIVHVGIVVEDAARIAVEMTRLLGIGPWTLMHVMPTDLTFHDKFFGSVPYVQAIALASFGDLQIELVEPLYGEGPHNEHLRNHGRSVQHISFGEVDDYDDMLAGLRAAGFPVEFQGHLAGAAEATYLDMVEDIGTVLEFTKPLPPAPPGARSGIVPLGTYAPLSPAVITAKGKKIATIGIVVGDAEKVAKRYMEIFGVGPWSFTDITARDVVLRGRSLGKASFSLKSGVARFGNFAIELLQPLSGPSMHVEFLGIHGNGIHHLSFGCIEDADEVAAAMQKEGYDVEMRAVIGGATESFYLSTRKKLGVVFQFDKKLG
jgi:hypothetical protein